MTGDNLTYQEPTRVHLTAFKQQALQIVVHINKNTIKSWFKPYMEDGQIIMYPNNVHDAKPKHHPRKFRHVLQYPINENEKAYLGNKKKLLINVFDENHYFYQGPSDFKKMKDDGTVDNDGTAE